MILLSILDHFQVIKKSKIKTGYEPQRSMGGGGGSLPYIGSTNKKKIMCVYLTSINFKMMMIRNKWLFPPDNTLCIYVHVLIRLFLLLGFFLLVV